MGSKTALRGKDLYGSKEYAEGSFHVKSGKNIFKKKKKFAVKLLTDPFPFSGPATAQQDPEHLSNTGIDSKYIFMGRVIDLKMTHNKLLEDPCDESTTPSPGTNNAIMCMHTQITLTKAGSMPTFKTGDTIICKFRAGDNGSMYDLQNADFVRVIDSFEEKKKAPEACQNMSKAFANTDFAGLGQVIPAGTQALGSSFGTAGGGGGGAMMTSAQSCGDTEPAPADWAQTTLYQVISKKGKSKKFTDVIPLDGGSIGIAHWADSGLDRLYKTMGDTVAQKHFGRSVSQLRSFTKQKNNCKGTTPMGENDNGTGCYSTGWWKSGMQKFTASPESKAIQTATWMKGKAGPGSEAAKAQGWVTGRQFAIAAGISNSLGVGGFKILAAQVGWDAEKTLLGYVNGISASAESKASPKFPAMKKHWQRRADVINSTWPCKNIVSAAPAAPTPKATGSATPAKVE